MGTLSSPAFVGRVDEIRALLEALAEASAGRPRIILLGGEAGVGKTRIIGEFAARARAVGAAAHVGGCLPIGSGGLPYAPLAEALRGLGADLGVMTASSEGRGAVRGGSDLAGALGIDSPGSGARDAGHPASTITTELRAPHAALDRFAQARLFEDLLQLLGDLGTRAPTVLVLEDVHWIDDATRDLLAFLARNLSRERVLILATFRTDELGVRPARLAWLAELARRDLVERLDLAPFTAAEVEAQLASIIGAPVDPDLRDEIHRRSAGNAFFAEELVAAGRDGDEGLPATVRESVLGRMEDASDVCRQVVRVAAVVGRPVDETLLGRVVGLSDAVRLAGAREAVDRGLLAVAPDRERYTFRHALVREAVEQDLLPGERRRLHGRCAEVLEADPSLAEPSGAGAAGELAHHWEAAGRSAEALRWSTEAGSTAVGVSAFAVGLRHYDRAIALWGRVPAGQRPPGIDWTSLLARTAEVANLANRTSRALELIRLAVDEVDPEADPAQAGSLVSRLGYFLWLAGRSEEALAAHRRAAELVPTDPPSRERARVAGALAGALMGVGRYRESIPVAREAIATAEAAGAAAEEGRARNILGCDLAGIGRIDGGLAELERARLLAEQHGPPDGLSAAFSNLAYNLLRADRFALAVERALEGRVAVRRIGLERRFGAALLAICVDGLFRLGRWDEAEAAGVEGLRLQPEGTVYLLTARARLQAHRGRFEESDRLLGEARRLGGPDVDPDLMAYLATVEAESAHWQDRPEAAADAVRRGLGHLQETDDLLLRAPLAAAGMRAAADLAEAARARRDRSGAGEAHSLIRAMDAELAGFGELSWAPPSIGATVSLSRAEEERAGAREPTDGASWITAVEAWEAIPSPAIGAYARYRAAEAWLRRGRAHRSQAAAMLAESREVALRLRAGPLLALVDGLARQARIELPAQGRERAALTEDSAPEPASPTAHGLTEREVEVLGLLARGLTNNQIAARLYISPKTAGVHVTHILTKLDVRNRVEAAIAAGRLGISGDHAAGPADGGGS